MELPSKYPTVEALLERADGEYTRGGKKEGIVIRPTEPVFREPLIIDNISKVFFSHGNFKIITLPASESDALQLRAMCFILPIHTFSEVELAQM